MNIIQFSCQFKSPFGSYSVLITWTAKLYVMAGFNNAKLHKPFFPFSNEANSHYFARHGAAVVESVAYCWVWKHPSAAIAVHTKCCGCNVQTETFIFDSLFHLPVWANMVVRETISSSLFLWRCKLSSSDLFAFTDAVKFSRSPSLCVWSDTCDKHWL